MEIRLVADTNLFFECKSLENLPWGELGYDSVVILLTKPVLDEIDKHKKGTGRTRKRALEIFSLVRGMLTSSTQQVEIKETSPKVMLRRMLNIAPDPAHNGNLDYAKTDERLIGITSTLVAQSSGYDVKLFTDDTGPASSADGMDIPYLMIPEAWRRPTSETTEEKRIKDLEKDLATYRAQEPKIVIERCEPANEDNIVAVTRKVATPLTQEEVEATLAKLRLKHPMTIDFTPPQTSTTTDLLGTTTTEYSAPVEAEINNYRNVLYPQWLNQCRTLLMDLQNGRDKLEPDILLRWSMANEGSRPASQVRVVFETRGPLALRRKTESDNTDDALEVALPVVAMARARLPRPPEAPAFNKRVQRQIAAAVQKSTKSFDLASLSVVGLTDHIKTAANISKGFDISNLKKLGLTDHSKILADASKALSIAGQLDGITNLWGSSAANEMARLLRSPASVADLIGSSSIDRIMNANISQRDTDFLTPIRIPQLPRPRDPESFYYDDWPEIRATSKGALTCALWRHKSMEETFEFDVIFTKDGEAGGEVECTVHADNLSRPEKSKVIVRRLIEQLSMMQLAETLVEECN